MKAKLNLVLALILFLGIFTFTLVNSASCAHWEWQNPLPTGNNLEDVWRSPDSSDVFAVGAYGAILRYNGSTWETMDSGIDTDLYGVWGTTSSDVFAVGRSGVILHFDGSSWTPQTSNTTAFLYDIWGSSGTDVYAVGSSGIIMRYNGTTWSVATSMFSATFQGVYGNSSTEVFAVGSAGTIAYWNGSIWAQSGGGVTTAYLYGVSGDGLGTVYAVGSGGEALFWVAGVGWQGLGTTGTSATLQNVWSSGFNDVIAVGNSGTIVHYDGAGWTDESTGINNTLAGVSGPAGIGTEAYAVGTSGIILGYNGSTWSPFGASGLGDINLTAIWGSSATNIFAVGYDGTIVRSDGTTWAPETSNTTETLNAVWGSSDSNVFAVGANGMVVQYNGSTWNPAPQTAEALQDVWGSSASDVFAVGGNGTIIHFDGSSWTDMSIVTTETFGAVWGSSASDVYAAGYSTLYHYDGSTWSEVQNVPISEFYDIWGSSSDNIYLVGYGGDVAHYNGTSWREIESMGYDLVAVWGTSADDVWIVDGNGLYHYDGYVWHPVSKIFNSPDAIWGSSPDNVYVVAGSGIVNYAVDAYYVDMSRPDDTGDGQSPATAWKYLHTAAAQINVMPAGNYRIQVAAGTYSVSNGEADSNLVITHDNVTLQGDAGAILDGESIFPDTICVNNWGIGVTVFASNVVLRDLDITRFRCDGSPGIDVTGGDNNRIEDCDVYDNDVGIHLANTGNSTMIVENSLYLNGIAISSDDAGMDVIGNKIYENGTGIELTNYSANIFLNFYNNLFYGTTTEHLYGIRVDAYGANTEITAFHNTITDIANSVYLFSSGQTAFLGANLRGNIIANADIGLVVDDGIGGTWSVGDYNTVFNCTTPYGTTVAPGQNDRTDDPLFVDPVTFDFHLQSTSPSRDHEPISGSYPLIYDLDGVDRPQGAGYDIGAYEYIDVQRNALIDIYNRTDGDNWVDNSGWKDNNPDPVDGFSESGSECTWYGVTCDVSDNVVGIDLYGNNLVGTLPSSISGLSNLQLLDLGNSTISGSFIPELTQLSNLQQLRLYYNSFTGSIPPEIQNLRNLQELRLEYCDFSGAIPAELGNITSLQQLALDSNQLSGTIPPELGNLSNVQQLSMSYNSLTGSIPPELGNLSNLQTLYLSRNQLSGTIPPELGNLSSLDAAYLHRNQLSGPIPSELGGLSTLRILLLSDNQLTGTIPASFSGLLSMTQLDLGNNQLTDPIPAELWGLTGMQTLDLADNDIGGSIPTQIGNLTNLAALFLDDNHLSGSIPAELGSLGALQYLYLHGNQLSGAIPVALSGLTSLVDGQNDFRWNALYTLDTGLQTFLSAKQNGGDWQSTQTVAPANLAAGSPTDTSIGLIWDPILYQGDFGGYEHYYATTSGGPYTLFGTTDGKAAPGATITGLSSDTTYYFRVRTLTNIHTYNTNALYSEYTNEVSATTTGGIVITQYTLTVSTAGEGFVKVNPPGSTFDSGTMVTLTPVPDEGWIFSGWSGDLTGAADPGSITMNSDQTVTATFVEKTSPEPPTADGPAHESIIGEGSVVTLDTSDYNDPDGDSHIQTHWEVWRADTETLLEGYPLTTTQDLVLHNITAQLDAGLKYAWRVGYEDSDGNVSWSQDYSFKVGTPEPDTLPEISAGTEVGDFGMISIVHWPNDPSPTAVFNIDYDPANYRIGTYDALTGSYTEFGDGLEMEPGTSYWILAREGLVVNFNGIPVSLIHDIERCLHVNEAAGNGWNMIAPPNDANYLWGNVQVGRYVEGSPGLTVAPISISDADTTVDTLIDRRIWQWEDGAYVSYLPAENVALESYSGYWVNAKLDGVYLVFPESAQVAGLSTPGNTLLALKGKALKWLKNLWPETNEAIADNDMPPMPMGGLDDNTVDPVFQGCFIEIADDFNTF